MQQNRRLHRKLNSRGFTLVEMAVTLTIVSLLLAVTFVGLRAWMRNSEFKKCNEYAHTLYTSASLELSSLELASDLDRFTERVKASGTPLQTTAQLGTGAPEDVYGDGRMYAISANAGEYAQYNSGVIVSAQASLVYELIDAYSYDKGVCNHTITMEYDTVSQSVYAVFISTKAESFVYSDEHGGDYEAYDESGVVSLNAAADYAQDRSSEVRKALMVGYYCVDDLGIRAAFNEGQLRITGCYLDNAETLDLVVSSNSRHEEADVKYTVTIYQTDGDQPLFDVTYSLMDLYAKGYKEADVQTPHIIKAAVSRYNGAVKSNQTEDMYFPVAFVDHELRITLDAVMSAQTGSVIGQGGAAAANVSTGFHRFLKNTTDTPDIYASARVQQLTEDDLPLNYDQEKRGVRLWIEDEEYVIGSSVVSNTENAFFASVKDGKAGIGSVRHLANIRYYDPDKAVTFQLVRDLQFEDAVIYDQNTARAGAENAMELMELHTTKAFPEIPEFSGKWTLTGEKTLSTQDYAINQLVLTDESIVTSVEKADEQYGIIGKNSGIVQHLALNGSTATLGYKAKVVSGVSDAAIKYELQSENDDLKVRAAGVLCGLNQGAVKNIAMDETTSVHLALNYTLVGSAAELATAKMHGIGLVCGVHEGGTSLTDIRTAGELEGYIYRINTTDAAAPAGEDAVQQRYRYAGIGGICGFTVGEPDGITAGQTATAIGSKLTIVDRVEDFLHLADRSSVKNTAEITGNTFVGGISGNIYLDSQLTDATNPIIDNCSNEGLIHLKGKKADLVACGTKNAATLEADDAHANADNCFAGGIVGYLQKGRIRDCTSAPGVNDSAFAEQVADAAPTGAVLEGDIQKTKAHVYLTQYLTGNYVGGIAGCVVTGELRDCQTTEGGYVLGNDEVGGIVGYLASLAQTGSGVSQNRLTMTDSKKLQNSCYVIGHSDVGGIVGSNRAGNVLSDCVNEGIVVGAGQNIGGIAGINRGSGTGEKEQAVIQNCTSEVFDYDDSIFTRVSEVWQIYGDNVGGLVGFNEYGTVTRADQTKTNISSIVVGNHNVGGVFGMAGTQTTFDFKHYTLDGGEVYANGDNVGGYIGINLSAEALPSVADYQKKPYEVKPYSVRGRYAVGGAVGANVILQRQSEDADVQVLFSNANAFGTVYGANAVGGIIGYQRKVVLNGYDKVYPKLTERLPSGGMDGVFASVRPSDAADRTSIGGYETIWMTDVTADSYAASGKTTITGDNAATVIAGSYGGGILGYGCGYDNILVKDCTNSGDVSDWQASGVTGSELIEGSIAISDLYKKQVENGYTVLDETAYSYDSMKQALSKVNQSVTIGSFVGGIQGYVSKNTTISGCTQTGMIYAQNGFGGIAGINLGTLKNCTVETNLGTQDSSLVGGLAAVNGASADVESCTVGTTASDYTIEGKNIVGGLFAINGAQNVSAVSGEIRGSQMNANISCSLNGYGIGGVSGIQTGTYLLNGALGADKSGLQISGGTAVGGIAGVMCGELQIQTEKVTNDTLAVNGVDAVGGVFGVLQGGRVVKYDSTKKNADKNADKNSDKTADYENAAAVTSSNGCAGGIVGRLASGEIRQATNLEQAAVTAYGEHGYAGGIVAYVEKNGRVESCTNQADVASMNSCAGGICAWNKGTLKNSNYAYAEKAQSISSDDDSMGVIAAYNDGTIESCNVVKTSAASSAAVTLQGNGSVIGGIVGTNTGTVSGCAMNVNYHLVTASDKDLTVGGAIGKNEWQSSGYVKNVSVNGFDITLLGNCAYFGGLIGCSSGAGIISDCSVEDLTVGEKDASLKGSCYGGLIGENASSVQNSTVKSIHAVVSGLYQANITLDAAKQENLASCFGGLVGKNQKDGSIEACTLDTSAGYDKNQIIVENGLVGGITGINKGTVTTSGYQASGKDSAVAIADGVKQVIAEYEKQYGEKSDTESHIDLQTERERVGYEYLIGENKTVQAMIKDRKTTGIPNLENILSTDDFNKQSVVQWMKNNGKPKLLLQLTGNGSIGGIAAYNTQSGMMQYCVTGQWLIDNRSSSQHSAQGGVIGTNESDQDTCFLINQAMVLRESASGVTERVNGGVIGYQHNTTDDQWKIYGCINTGMVINVNSHYSGGIIGRWSDQGGSIEYCRNYGVMQTSYQAEYKGAAGGIVAQLYHPLDEQSYTVLSCRNDGSILGVGSNCRSAGLSANDSGGIMGNIVTYEAKDASAAQAIQVNLIDCVNGPDVMIVSKSMCSGILTFLTSDKANSSDAALSQLELNIDRCRNYATDFVASSGGYVGIFSDRMSGHEKTRITNCFTVAVDKAMQGNQHKGYICYDGEATNKASYKYDGGKGAICYNNRVLLVTTNNDKKTVDESVQLKLGRFGTSIEGNIKGDGMCYTILHSKAQHADGLEQLLEGNGAYTVSGTHEGAQLYIQLKEPMKLKELSLGFAQNAAHSYRVEYLTADGANGNKGSLTGNNFTLASEVICKEGATETVSFPQNVPVYAIRMQYVENGINQNAKQFNQYGYYYSDKQNPFVLQSLQLKWEDGRPVKLDAYDQTIISPRLVDSEVTNNDRLRNGSAQYLYVANQKGRTYLIEPQFEQQRLSAGEDQRKAYQKDQYTIAGNELFTDGVRPYGMIYAMTDSSLAMTGDAQALDCEKLDQVICDHYKTALAAAMPYEEGSLLPETPDKVNVALDAEAATVNVSWANSIDGARNVVKYYLVTVKDQNGTEYLSEKKCIGNSVKLDITSDMVGKRLRASVRAVNENGTSGEGKSNESAEISEPMLTPQIRLELIKSGGTYKYQISLENQKDYEEAYAGNWNVTVYRQGTGQGNTKICSLSADKPFDLIDGFNIKEIKDGNYSPSQAIWQLYAQARSKEKDHTIPASERYSTSVYTPKYQSGKNNYIVPGIQTLYATLDDNYQSELDAKINVYVASDTSKTGIYPVYQVDLIRVDSEGEEHILASKELAVSDQTSKLTFSDLPSEFFDADKTQYFYVRAWVSQTGVGPVYTWHETDTLEQNGSLLVNTTETEQKYVAGTLLSDAQAFGTRIRTTQKPEKDGATVSLSGTDANAVYARTKDYAMSDRPTMNVDQDVTAVYDPVKDRLFYTFRWSDASEQTGNYELRIYSRGDDGKKILLKKKYPIPRGDTQTSDQFTVDDLTSYQLELVIIQRDTGYAPGDTGASDQKGKVVPRILQQSINIRTRLPKLSQPSVKLVSQNDLKYRISWQDISARVNASKRDALRYALYVESDGERKLLLTTAENEAECSLEDYAGKTIRIYAVAYTDKSDLEAKETTALSLKGTYFKSPVGLKKRLTVGSRLAQPVFAEAPFSWSYRDYAIDLGNAKHVLTESQFTSNALKFNIRLTANGNYVMNAVLFDTREEAQRFIDGLPGTPYAYAQYVELERILGDQNYKRLSEGGKPVMLSLKNKKQSIYMAATSFKDISYAGGYIVPLVRATASTDISSYWSCGTPYQIPRVMLDTPNLEQVLTEKNYASFGESLRNSVSTSGTPFTNVTVQYETYRFRVPSYVKENRLTLAAGDGRQYALTVSGDRVIVHSSEDVDSAADKQVNPAGGYDYIYSLSGEEECLLDVIRNPVSGTYRASKTVRAAYRMTFDAGIRRIETDGVVTYELRLPQTRYAVTCNGGISISGTSRLITDVYIQAVPKDESRYQASAAKPEESP